MVWQQWLLIAFLALGAISTVSCVGKPRKPIDPEMAAWTVIIVAGLIVAVVTI